MINNLLATPGLHRELAVKLNYNGVTVLKESSFRSRLSGSRSVTLLPNGELVSNELLKKLQPIPEGKPITKKIDKKNGETISPIKNESLSPSKEREYRVNKKVIRQRVYAYLLGQQKPILHGFVVSFPPCVDDDLAYRAFNIWLTTCREKLNLREYLWTAERQENGTIHYHILVPQFLNVQKANRAMSNTLANFVRKKELNWNVHAAKRYNGVDISKNRKTKKITNFALGSNSRALSNYITKYISKNDNPFRHYAWHNSRGFSAVFTSLSLTETEAKYFKIRGALNMDRCFVSEYATFVGWDRQPADVYLNALAFVNRIVLNKGPDELIHKKLSLNFSLLN